MSPSHLVSVTRLSHTCLSLILSFCLTCFSLFSLSLHLNWCQSLVSLLSFSLPQRFTLACLSLSLSQSYLVSLTHLSYLSLSHSLSASLTCVSLSLPASPGLTRLSLYVSPGLTNLTPPASPGLTYLSLSFSPSLALAHSLTQSRLWMSLTDLSCLSLSSLSLPLSASPGLTHVSSLTWDISKDLCLLLSASPGLTHLSISSCPTQSLASGSHSHVSLSHFLPHLVSLT